MADARDVVIRQMELAWEMAKIAIGQNPGGDQTTRIRNINESFKELFDGITETINDGSREAGS